MQQLLVVLLQTSPTNAFNKITKDQSLFRTLFSPRPLKTPNVSTQTFVMLEAVGKGVIAIFFPLHMLPLQIQSFQAKIDEPPSMQSLEPLAKPFNLSLGAKEARAWGQGHKQPPN